MVVTKIYIFEKNESIKWSPCIHWTLYQLKLNLKINQDKELKDSKKIQRKKRYQKKNVNIKRNNCQIFLDSYFGMKALYVKMYCQTQSN